MFQSLFAYYSCIYSILYIRHSMETFLDLTVTTWSFAHMWSSSLFSVLITLHWVSHIDVVIWFYALCSAQHSLLLHMYWLRPDWFVQIHVWFLFLRLLFARIFLTSLPVMTVRVMRLHHATASCKVAPGFMFVALKTMFKRQRYVFITVKKAENSSHLKYSTGQKLE